ncbi:MAG: transporter substrate-binding domain-containing protein [Deltaproteobacteria bacterium]|nr:transporter substrate-binding domain-containing protein [Deltaproteobacteria bacterium]
MFIQKMFFREVLTVFLLAVIGMPMQPASASESSTSGLVKAAVLKNFPPQYSTSKDGMPQGFAIDIIEEIAKIAGFEIEYVIKESWEEVFEAVKSGQADIIPNQGITDVREQWFSFSLPVETFPVSLFTRTYEKDISSVSSLFGRKVAVIRLNVGEVLMRKQSGVLVRTYDHIQDALFALLSGNVDALIFPEPVLWKLARDAGIEDKIKVVGQPLIEILRSVSVSKDNTALLNKIDAAVRTLVGSAEYQKIYTKWYGQPKPFWTTQKVAGFMTALIILVVLFMGSWRYLTTIKLNKALKENIHKRKTAEIQLQKSYDTLEQKVEERTSELQKALAEVKTLSGLLPICSYCKKIRDDQGYWEQIEIYISQHSNAEFSHGICKECAQKHYPDLGLFPNEFKPD